MSKIAGEINAEMMHPKVIHEQRKPCLPRWSEKPEASSRF